jgi:hypothetical protein
LQDLSDSVLLEYAGLYKFLSRNAKLNLKAFFIFVGVAVCADDCLE